MTKHFDFSKTCRICLQENGFINIFVDDGNQNFISPKEIIEKVIASLPFEISVDDGLPDVICAKCYGLLHTFEDFLLQFQNSNQILENYYLINLKEIEVEEVDEIQLIKDYKTKDKNTFEIQKLNDEDIPTTGHEEEICDGESTFEDSFGKNCDKQNIIYVDQKETNNYLKEDDITEEIITEEIDELDEIYHLFNDSDDTQKNSKPVNNNNNNKINDIEDDEDDEKEEVFIKNEKDIVYEIKLIHSNPKNLKTKSQLKKQIILRPCDGGDVQNNLDFVKLEESHEDNDSKEFKELRRKSGNLNKEKTRQCENKSEIPGTKINSTLSDQKFKCPYCPKWFEFLETLKQHAFSHKKPKLDETKHVCTECSISFKRADHLKMHQNAVHLKNYAFRCEYEGCPKSFLTNWARNKHYNKDHSDRIVMFQCSTCQKQYKNMSSLRRHEKCHYESFGIQCNICLQLFARTDILREHLKTHNLDESETQKLISETYDQIRRATEIKE